MSDNAPEIPQPASLGAHRVPEDRAELIRKHVAMLSETALAVSETLPFTADATDFVRVLESVPQED